MLFLQPQFSHQRRITFRTILAQIIQKFFSLANYFQQSPTRMMILWIILQVPDQFKNLFRQQSDLNFAGAAIAFVKLKLINGVSFLPSS